MERYCSEDGIQDLVVLINPYIHEKAKIRKTTFLDRIKKVEYLRSTREDTSLTFYITNLDEYNQIEKFYNLVNNSNFEFGKKYLFAIGIAPKLYDWFKNTELNTIRKQIVCWIASLYFFNEDRREALEGQIYDFLLDEALDVVDKYFKKHITSNIFDEENYEYLVQGQICLNLYFQVCKDYYDCVPPEFLSSPFRKINYREWMINPKYFSFENIQGYLNQSDWESIILNEGSNDDMLRAESRRDLFLEWKHGYTTYNTKKKISI